MFLLVLPLKVQAEDGFIEDSRCSGITLDFFFRGYPAKFIQEATDILP
jgi:hypothetical protein